MRARSFIAIAFACAAFAAGGCTVFIAAELSGDQGTDAGADSGNGTDGALLGNCFQLTNNQCGACIANSCENPSGSPPVSLVAVCNLDEGSELIDAVGNCAQDPDVLENSDCEDLFVDGGTYATSISTAAAAENNLQKCINDNCRTSCSECNVDVPTCESQTVPLAQAGACGTCLDNAMNRPGAPCQTYILQGACVEDPQASPVALCAPPSGQCTAPDCSGLQTPDQADDDAGYALYTCLWQHCQGSCPNQ